MFLRCRQVHLKNWSHKAGISKILSIKQIKSIVKHLQMEFITLIDKNTKRQSQTGSLLLQQLHLIALTSAQETFHTLYIKA